MAGGPEVRPGAFTRLSDSGSEVARLRRDLATARADATSVRAILASATEHAILTLDPSGRISSWNVGACRLFGWEEEEALGMDGRRLFTPEEQARRALDAEMASALADGHADEERWLLRRDGSRFFAHSSLTPLRETPDGGFLKIVRDRTADQLAMHCVPQPPAREQQRLHQGARPRRPARAHERGRSARNGNRGFRALPRPRLARLLERRCGRGCRKGACRSPDRADRTLLGRSSHSQGHPQGVGRRGHADPGRGWRAGTSLGDLARCHRPATCRSGAAGERGAVPPIRREFGGRALDRRRRQPAARLSQPRLRAGVGRGARLDPARPQPLGRDRPPCRPREGRRRSAAAARRRGPGPGVPDRAPGWVGALDPRHGLSRARRGRRHPPRWRHCAGRHRAQGRRKSGPTRWRCATRSPACPTGSCFSIG